MLSKTQITSGLIAGLPYLLVVSTVLLGACNSSSSTPFVAQSQPGQCPVDNLSISICDAGQGQFSTTSSNPYFPFAVGNRWVLEGEEDGETIRVEIVVLDETEQVAGVTTRVLEAREFEDGELIEIARDFYAQAPDGTVCYFGEDVENYEDGEFSDTNGTWRAGENSNLPGIVMPGAPSVGQAFFQEFAPGIAEDMAEVVVLRQTVTTPAGSYSDTVGTLDTNPLDDCDEVEPKFYARGVGMIDDDGKQLVSFQP